MERLLPALDGLAPAYLVGGAVRDLLRGADAVDLDVAVEGDARAVARALADRVRGEAREHERFGTATVRADGLNVDLATTRREDYPEPGALPEVEEAGLDEDLARRDFTINAMALGLSGDDLGHLYDPRTGLTDLEEGLVRVLHDRSFADDPTRLLRALRYEARLRYRMEPATERLARDAAAEGGLRAVSGARVRDELMDLLAEPELPSAVVRMRELGVDRAMHTALEADTELVASAGLGAVASGRTGRWWRSRRSAPPPPTGSISGSPTCTSRQGIATPCPAPPTSRRGWRASCANASTRRLSCATSWDARRLLRSRSRWPWERPPSRSSVGSRSCATSGSRSAGRTCSRRASRRAPS